MEQNEINGGKAETTRWRNVLDEQGKLNLIKRLLEYLKLREQYKIRTLGYLIIKNATWRSCLRSQTKYLLKLACLKVERDRFGQCGSWQQKFKGNSGHYITGL